MTPSRSDAHSHATVVTPRPAGIRDAEPAAPRSREDAASAAANRAESAPPDAAASRAAAAHEAELGAVCERYYRAIGARDADGVIEAMTARYGGQLRQMRQWPEFGAFFRLWCEAQGTLKRVLARQLDGDSGTVLLDLGGELVRVALRRIDARWLVDSEQSERRR